VQCRYSVAIGARQERGFCKQRTRDTLQALQALARVGVDRVPETGLSVAPGVLLRRFPGLLCGWWWSGEQVGHPQPRRL
jgi:hypothetical protein